MALALLVDDDTGLLASVEGTVSVAGLDLVTAASWDEGLALFQILSPDLIIADYNMPESSHGLRLLVRMRRLRPSVKVALVSGYLSEDDLKRVADRNFVDTAMTKGSAVETARAITSAVKDLGGEAAAPTDWVEYAEAYLRTSQLSTNELDELDALLADKVEDA